jgi:hypothetical protein
MITYWGLHNPLYAALPGVAAARSALVSQGLALLMQEWGLFRQVTENYNGIVGVGEDVGNADPFCACPRVVVVKWGGVRVGLGWTGLAWGAVCVRRRSRTANG